MRNQTIVLGRGINDADYKTQLRGETGNWRCPYYTAWCRMLATKDPICDDWLVFSRFKRWMASQTWEGRFLDRLLLGDGKLYMPKRCCFLDRATYKIVRDIKLGRKGGIDTPRGTRIAKPFRVTCNGRHIGYYPTLKLAEVAWAKARKIFLLQKSRDYHGAVRVELERLAREKNGSAPRF
jgi:hypothetical protein